MRENGLSITQDICPHTLNSLHASCQHVFVPLSRRAIAPPFHTITG